MDQPSTVSALATKGRTSDGDDQAGPRSVQRLLKILSLLASARGGLGLAELSQELAAPKSSLLNLLRPLVASDFLLLHNNAYLLGPGMFQLAARILAKSSTAQFIPYLEEVARLSHETVSLAVLDADLKRVVFTSVLDSPHPLRYVVTPGSSAPLYCTAAGRVFLAFGAPEWRDRYLAETILRQRTPETVKTVPRLLAILDEVRKTGISHSSGEIIPRTAALAAPIFDSAGRVVAALGVSAPVERIDENAAFMADLLRQTAARASGATPPR